MPLIILTGYPCSGLTHRAQQLASGLEEAQSKLLEVGAFPPSKPRYKVNIVSTHDNVNYPRTVYDTARTEKEARGLAYTRAKRALGRDSFVILDGMNYIKGYRYQLWCEAKALATTCCVVHVGTPIDQCVANNEERIRKKESQSKSAENEDKEPSTTADEPTIEQPSASPEESDPYPPELLNNLIFRYEEPSMHSRWDKPLFTVPYADATPPIADIWTALTGLPHHTTLTQPADEEPSAVSELTTALNSTTLSSAASTATGVTRTQGGGVRSSLTRPRVAIKPHQATVLPTSTDSSALYNMEKRTSAIIQAIRSFTISNPSAKAALATAASQQSHEDTDTDTPTRRDPGIRIPVPEASLPIFIPAHIASASVTDDLAAAGGILALPRLQRLRRQWITLNRVYIAGPHAAVKGGALREADVPDAFVRFLNADFADEHEGS
ncbi:RNA polymerase II Elongator complex associated protein Kti12 [Aspergillus heterothallicus]